MKNSHGWFKKRKSQKPIGKKTAPGPKNFGSEFGKSPLFGARNPPVLPPRKKLVWGAQRKKFSPPRRKKTLAVKETKKEKKKKKAKKYLKSFKIFPLKLGGGGLKAPPAPGLFSFFFLGGFVLFCFGLFWGFFFFFGGGKIGKMGGWGGPCKCFCPGKKKKPFFWGAPPPRPQIEQGLKEKKKFSKSKKIGASPPLKFIKRPTPPPLFFFKEKKNLMVGAPFVEKRGIKIFPPPAPP